jgi:Concanavalin A-like lectin/glucanases superfamily
VPRLVYVDPTLYSHQYVTALINDPNVPSARVSTLVLRDGASAYWKLDDSGSTAADSAGANTGTITGGVTKGTTGLLLNDTDTAMTFDGSSGFVDVGTTSLVNNFRAHDWTVEYWIKPTLTQNFVFACGQFNNAGGDNFLHIGFDGSNHVKVGFFGDDSTGTAALSTGTTYHIVVTFSASTRARVIYINGSIDKQDTATGPLNVPAAATVQIARAAFASGNGPFFYSGVVDDVAVYPSVLTGPQVLAHYQMGAVTGPRAYILTSGSDGAVDASLQQYVAGRNSGGYPAYTGDSTQAAVSPNHWINGILGRDSP